MISEKVKFLKKLLVIGNILCVIFNLVFLNNRLFEIIKFWNILCKDKMYLIVKY